MSICPTCARSKTVEGAKFVHVRLGLDEPPEPLLCKCKEQSEIIRSIMARTASATRVMRLSTNATMDTIPKMNMDSVMIRSVSKVPHTEVELRLNKDMSVQMGALMKLGMLGYVSRSSMEETGCYWWSGPKLNLNGKVRCRTGEGKVVKFPVSVYTVVPGVKLAVSHEYSFEGDLIVPDYNTEMDELKCMCELAGVEVTVICRTYNSESKSSYSCEIELSTAVTGMQIKGILNEVMSLCGSVRWYRNELDYDFMSAVRSSDHAVVDVSDMSSYPGPFMTKVDGMKVYVFCYKFGYVITYADANLTVQSCVVSHLGDISDDISYLPDVIVAELMLSGDLVYIDMLCTNGVVASPSREYQPRPVTLMQRPPMIVRTNWSTFPTKGQLASLSMKSDGVVCVTNSRTLRLKEPTVDLRLKGGYLCAVEEGQMVKIVGGCKQMVEGMIYELNVNRDKDTGSIMLSNPKERLSKHSPNSVDIVKRAVMVVSRDPDMNTVLFDITNMSFMLRTRVYEMAQSVASTTRKVIVTFGSGRLQEWRQMYLSNFSYIAIDPEISVERLAKSMPKCRIVPYDMSRPLSIQVSSISNRPGTVLYYRGLSEDFVMRTNACQTMFTMGIPAVFSFSISYHIGLINTLMLSGVNVFGCGYIHDNMHTGVVGSRPASMTVRKSSGIRGPTAVVSSFGKSTYVEPFLSMRSIKGLRLVKDAQPDVWSNVDTSTYDIMSRAVVMCGS